MSLDEETQRRVARYEDRREDWDVFACETELKPDYARSQRRYIGAFGSVDHADPKAITPTTFTMSIQTTPAGNRIPAHWHEIEETFCTVRVYREEETATISLGKWISYRYPP